MIAVLDTVGAQPDRILHRFGVGRVSHDLEAALATDLKGGADLAIEQE
jgi:hypothetical protein